MANRPSSTAPIKVGSRRMRPAASQAARPEPTAMKIEKIARQAVTTSSLPPSTFLTSGGISESATAPTSQNQLVTSAPHSRRGSARRNFSRPAGEARGFFFTTTVGGGRPGGGGSKGAPPHPSE